MTLGEFLHYSNAYKMLFKYTIKTNSTAIDALAAKRFKYNFDSIKINLCYSLSVTSSAL
jgi:hypothetical protein